MVLKECKVVMMVMSGDGLQDAYGDIHDVHDADVIAGGVDVVPDGDTGGVLLVLPVDHHPVTGVAVHTVLHCGVQLAVRLFWYYMFFCSDFPGHKVHFNIIVRKVKNLSKGISFTLLGHKLFIVYGI